MPKLSVWLVRTALIHLGIGFSFGSLILHHKGVPIYGWTWKLLTPHIAVMSFGWTMQFVMGLAFWILPRFSGEIRYGKLRLGWYSFWLLNTGILLMAIGGWFTHNLLSLFGHLCVLSAIAAFVVLITPRVKPLRSSTASQDSKVFMYQEKSHAPD
jgi:hypothetical protein